MDVSSEFHSIRMIHAAFCGSVLIYGLVACLMLSQGIIPETGFAGDLPGLNIIRAIIWLFAAGSYVGIRILRARSLRVEALRHHTKRVTQVMNARLIVMYALADAIAIYGFLLFMLAASLQDFLLLAGAALLTLHWLRPKEDAYRALARQAIHTSPVGPA